MYIYISTHTNTHTINNYFIHKQTIYINSAAKLYYSYILANREC